MSRAVKTTCPYCGVGCGVDVAVNTGAPDVVQSGLIAVSGDKEHPANVGKLCVKGTNLAATLGDATRLKAPYVDGVEVSWSEAIRHVADGFRATIDRFGPDSVAFYLSGQLLTEDYYVANKLMKGFIGSANVDTNSRLCMASAVAAHKRAFGEDVVPCDYQDLNECELLVMVGSNAAWAHPVLFQSVLARRQAGALKVVVIDPRATTTAQEADLHLAVNPGADLALFNGLLAHLHRVGATDLDFIQTYTDGFASTLEEIGADDNTLADVASACGLTATELQTFFELFVQTKKVVTLYSQGVNQSVHGADQCNAIINCHLATGRLGQPGMGPFSITGQPNAMGGREVGGMANTLAAHMDFDADSTDKVARFWQAPSIAKSPGLKAVDMFDAVASGQIKAIWIMATNPAVSLPDSQFIAKALSRCPLVVVSDCYADTDTVALADVRLPAQGWGEKDGTVTNSERCISRQRRFAEPEFDARADWRIVCDVAQAMGFRAGFNFTSPAQVFAEHAALSAFENRGERLFDLSAYTHMTEEAFDQMRPAQWPPNRRPFGDRLFSTPDGRARFVGSSASRKISTNSDFPLLLNTGRLRDQWHTMSRTGLAAVLNQHTPEPRLDIHPQDAQRLDIAADQLVEVLAPTGKAYYLATLTESVGVGEVFAPIHWTQAHAGSSVVSTLVPRAVDPFSGQPQSKQVAVAISPVTNMLWMRGVLYQADQLRLLRSLLNEHSTYWCALPGSAGVLFESACGASEAADLFAALTNQFKQANWSSFRSGSAEKRMLLLDGQEPLMALCQSSQRSALPVFAQIVAGSVHGVGDTAQPDTPDSRWRALAYSAQAVDTSMQICSCFQVSQSQISQSLADGVTTVEGLGSALKCGTNCGSCVPELKRLIQDYGGFKAEKDTQQEREKDDAIAVGAIAPT